MVDAVILTGAYETAELFRSWRADLKILAETSGKNALIITPNADLDEAVADLVAIDAPSVRGAIADAPMSRRVFHAGRLVASADEQLRLHR